MKTLTQNLRSGFQLVCQSYQLIGAALFALALGIGANSAIFGVVNPASGDQESTPSASQIAMVWIGGESTRPAASASTFGGQQESTAFTDIALLERVEQASFKTEPVAPEAAADLPNVTELKTTCSSNLSRRVRDTQARNSFGSHLIASLPVIERQYDLQTMLDSIPQMERRSTHFRNSVQLQTLRQVALYRAAEFEDRSKQMVRNADAIGKPMRSQTGSAAESTRARDEVKMISDIASRSFAAAEIYIKTQKQPSVQRFDQTGGSHQWNVRVAGEKIPVSSKSAGGVSPAPVRRQEGNSGGRMGSSQKIGGACGFPDTDKADY